MKAAAPVLLAMILAAYSGLALAQESNGGLINPGRDCKSITTCNFKRTGSYRGCLSSYSCRVCEFQPARCSIGGARAKVCERLVCRWGA